MIVVIDNKDSFTYNLINYFKMATRDMVNVIDVEEINIEELKALKPKAIVISPGPGRPSDYPILFKVMDDFYQHIPILGVCLGFQMICQYFGGIIIHRDRPIHGHTTLLSHYGEGMFQGLPEKFNVMLYHSLQVDENSIPSELNITSKGEDDVIMGLQHDKYPIYGLQYHPESILSEQGQNQIQNFIDIVGENSDYQI
ncbi:aminodeoxychorismate/anthranilate synthase component II [Staphylococcus warneri]|nr:aminodeoxychorismate/anthranilate synthase component II [Staphylococcus warneri]